MAIESSFPKKSTAVGSTHPKTLNLPFTAKREETEVPELIDLIAVARSLAQDTTWREGCKKLCITSGLLSSALDTLCTHSHAEEMLRRVSSVE